MNVEKSGEGMCDVRIRESCGRAVFEVHTGIDFVTGFWTVHHALIDDILRIYVPYFDFVEFVTVEPSVEGFSDGLFVKEVEEVVNADGEDIAWDYGTMSFDHKFFTEDHKFNGLEYKYNKFSESENSNINEAFFISLRTLCCGKSDLCQSGKISVTVIELAKDFITCVICVH